MGVALTVGRTQTNVALAAGAVILWILMALVTGRIGVNEGLGFDGAGFDGMVRGFTLKGGDEPTRVSPLLPALAWIPYAVIHDVPRSLTAVDAVSIAVLVFAACMLIDDRRGDWRCKLFVALALTMTIAFGKVAAFVPGSASLCALAALMLAIARCDSERPTLTAAAHVAAVMALPIGLVAPLYGVVRGMRLRMRASRIALTFVPAALMWLFVQWWARGGVAGALDDFSPHKLFGSVDIWTQPLFATFALYFFVTAGGGLSMIAFAQPWAWGRMARRSPEAAVLTGAVLVYVIALSGAAPLAFGFLAPVWVLVCVEWSACVQPRRAWWWFAAGLLLTLVTQRPLAHVDTTSYFVDWHPYDVYRGSVPIHYDQLWERWLPRLLFVAVALWVLALVAGDATFARAGRERSAALPEPIEPPTAHVTQGWRERVERWSRLTVTTTRGRQWAVFSYVYAVLLATLTGYFLFGLPIQLSDSFANLLAIQSGSAWDVFKSQLQQTGYLRPLLHVQLKIVYDLAAGNYFPWFRSVQVVQVFAALLLAVRLLRPRHAADLLVVPCCLAMVLGLHTFAGTIREAFPINTFLTLVVCCLAAANLSATRGGWLADAAAGLLLVFSLLTLETGILVWVIFVAGYIAGYRGVSARGLLLVTALLAGYFAWRLLFLHVGAPGLDERSTGFGFAALDPPEIIARFGRNPLPFYLYNYVSAVMSVLFAEPRAGVWRLVSGISQGSVEVWDAINVATSTLTTIVLARYIARRLRSWLHASIDDGDRLVLLFLAVLPVNALLCVVYAKDVIMSPAGVFYALAAAVAIRELILSATLSIPPRAPVWAVVMLALVSTGWGWRLVGIHYSLRTTAAQLRSDWGYEDQWEARNHERIETAEAKALKRTLLDDAIWRRPAPPRLDLGWADHAFDKTQ